MANKIPRVPVREQDPKVRATNFEEVCYGYDLEEAALEASRCLQCKNPRCVAACPVNIRIPDFIGALHRGELQQAADIIAEDSSLPSICGRVCPQEIAVRRLLRAAASRANRSPSANSNVS